MGQGGVIIDNDGRAFKTFSIDGTDGIAFRIKDENEVGRRLNGLTQSSARHTLVDVSRITELNIACEDDILSHADEVSILKVYTKSTAITLQRNAALLQIDANVPMVEHLDQNNKGYYYTFSNCGGIVAVAWDQFGFRERPNNCPLFTVEFTLL